MGQQRWRIAHRKQAGADLTEASGALSGRVGWQGSKAEIYLGAREAPGGACSERGSESAARSHRASCVEGVRDGPPRGKGKGRGALSSSSSVQHGRLQSFQTFDFA